MRRVASCAEPDSPTTSMSPGGAQQVGEATTDDLMVVEQEDTDHPSFIPAGDRRSKDLVLGSHGHRRVRHTVLGSVSEDCIRKATCPVVVIPVPADRRQPADDHAMRS